MKVRHLIVAILAGVGVEQAALSQAPVAHSQLSMCVTTAIGTCGNLCQPFDCQPNYTLVSSYENMVFDIAGAPNMPYVLFVGLAAPGCLKVPGVEGELATWTVAAPIVIGTLSQPDPDLACMPARDTYTVSVPVVYPGVDMRFQLLGMDGYLRADQPVLSFSRATEVRTR